MSEGASADARTEHSTDFPLIALPRGDRRSTAIPALDVNLPALILRLGSYPLHLGTVGIIRTLGRAGVPVYSVTEDRFTPAALCHYLTGRVSLGSSTLDNEQELLEQFVAIASRFPAKPLVICTDDEAAVLVAEAASRLREYVLLPEIPPSLPRRLASKRGLYEICKSLDVPTPKTAFPVSLDEFDRAVADIGLPVVVKNADPWVRLTDPVVTGSVMISTREELDRLRWVLGQREEPFCILVQEYLSETTCDDWFADGYCTTYSDVSVIFTGRKLHSWVPLTGSTAYARGETNGDIVDIVRLLCKRIGYCGPFDLDWRYDHRTGTYHLLDFNPRVGAQFRIFEDDAGIDVIRAMHLDMSGRPIPVGRQVEGERFIVENLELAARRFYRGRTPELSAIVGAPRRVRLAWFTADDPLPMIAAAIRQIGGSVASRFRRFALRRSHPNSPCE